MMVRRQPGALSHTGQTAAITTETLCAASAGACNTAGQYHVHLDMWQSGAACSSVGSGAIGPSITWTDRNGTAHTANLPMITQASSTALTTTWAPAATVITAWSSGDFNISTNGSVIQDAFTYTNCTTGTFTWNADISVTRLQ
jgi:hypothetical protein